MFILYRLLITFLLALCFAAPTFSQKGKSFAQHQKRKSKIICPIFENGKYPFQGLGIKLGDPFAITYKMYFSDHFGIVLDAGKASSGLYSQYFRSRFNDVAGVDTLSAQAQLDYLSHRVKADWVFELKFLWHLDAKAITPGLRFYFGLGPELKITKLEYQYLYTNEGGGYTFNAIGHFNQRETAFGPQLIMGIEYSYFQIPISAFMELELFNDISLDPGRRRFEGGVGLRYIF